MKAKKIIKIAYCVIFFLALAVPGVMTFTSENKTIGNEEKISRLENFGFRNELINLNNEIYYNVFGQSGEDSVIAGSDGWLFYESALHDYTGSEVLSTEEIAQIAQSVKYMEDSVRAQGAEFVFVVAPNKIEIYGEYMPYYTVASKEDGNYELLMDALDKAGVTYTDLKSELLAAKEDKELSLYHRLDSHWNNIGASIAYETIMDKVEMGHTVYDGVAYDTRCDFDGDLYSMLFPMGTKKDYQHYYNVEENFYYTSRFHGADDLYISTENETGSGSVLVFRDSFGNALYPFFANDFAKADFSRALPYDVTEVEEYDVVVVEIVERNIANLLEYVPVTK